MANSETITLDGLDDLLDSLQKLADNYSDKAGVLLQRQGRAIRKDAINNAKRDTKSTGETKNSLTTTSAYEVSRPKGYGSNQQVTISAKAKHFHLIEHGHELVTHDGRVIGFVPGYHMLDQAVKKADKEFPEAVSKMVDELMKEAKL